MKVLSLCYWKLLQHYSHINPPWIKAYAALLGPNAVAKRERGEVVKYARAVWALKDLSKLVYFYLELLASRHDNKLPYNLGWLAHELSILKVAQSQRSLDACLDDVLDVGLAEVLDVTAFGSARQSPLSTLSSLDSDSFDSSLVGFEEERERTPANARGALPSVARFDFLLERYRKFHEPVAVQEMQAADPEAYALEFERFIGYTPSEFEDLRERMAGRRNRVSGYVLQWPIAKPADDAVQLTLMWSFSAARGGEA